MYTVYATSQEGDGYVQQLGEYDSVEEIMVRVGMFSPDVVITIEKSTEENRDCPSF